MNKLDLSQLSSNMTIIENFSVLNNTGDFMQFIKLEDTKFICGVTTTPTCIKPSKLTGLGDNISSTGFTYQNRIK
jgi:transaldolase